MKVMNTKIIMLGGDFISEPCEYCGKVEELRPYGMNGAKICFDCGMKPENIEDTEKAFDDVLSGKSEHPTKEQSN
jgi:pentose-5-phosphate-3-epimerase